MGNHLIQGQTKSNTLKDSKESYRNNYKFFPFNLTMFSGAKPLYELYFSKMAKSVGSCYLNRGYWYWGGAFLVIFNYCKISFNTLICYQLQCIQLPIIYQNNFLPLWITLLYPLHPQTFENEKCFRLLHCENKNLLFLIIILNCIFL
jgi:hypothetical protein